MKPHAKIWIVVGTRPECIKQAPVCAAFRDLLGADRVALIGTGQHKRLLQTALDDFGLELDENFEIMRHGQSVSEIMAAVLTRFEALARRNRPEWVVVQGDTTTACAAALAAFQMGIKVAHNEAGLRSYDMANPFPEEANRRIIGTIAEMHFAPTVLASEALLREGIPADKIHVVGNPGIDSFLAMLQRESPDDAIELVRRLKAEGQEIALLTAHRREAEGRGMDNLFRALKEFLTKETSISLIYTAHPNALGDAAAKEFLAPLGTRVAVVAAMSYRSICHILSQCSFVVTDSGGIQEEAATLGIPTVVCRRTTERREAVEIGISRVAGLETANIISTIEWAFEQRRSRNTPWSKRPFGDGSSGVRIAKILAARLETGNV